MSKTPEAVRGLTCAAGIGDVDGARILLRRAPEAARDWRPIIEASYKGFAEIVKVLVKHGADVNAISTGEYNRPLHQAASRGNARIVSALLERGANPKARDHDGKTPLDVAYEKRRTAVVEILSISLN